MKLSAILYSWFFSVILVLIISTLIGFDQISKNAIDIVDDASSTNEQVLQLEEQRQKTLQNWVIILLLVFVVAALLFSIIIRGIINPILSLSKASQEYSEGGEIVIEKILKKRNNEIGVLSRNFENMMNKITKHELSLNQSIEKLKELDRSKDQFISLASHELKSPLIPIMGFLETILDNEYGKLNSAQKKRLQICYDNAENLNALINDFLDSSKLDLKKIKLILKNNNLKEIALNVKNSLDSFAAQKNAKIVVKSYNVFLRCDKLRITQILNNLVRNSISYSDKRRNKVEVIISRNAGKVNITVKDQGIGIPKAVLPKLFNKFYRAQQAVISPHGGTGLGLVITKGLVELHGGRIMVKSKLGKGTEFNIRIPLR